MLAEALLAEVDEHIEPFRTLVDQDGKRRVIRNGYLPEREFRIGVGKIPIQQQRVRVRGAGPGSVAPTISVPNVVDLPDRKLALMMRLLHQGNGKLSRSKRENTFPMLRDIEVGHIEAAFRKTLGS